MVTPTTTKNYPFSTFCIIVFIARTVAKLLIFHMLRLKTPIHICKIGVFQRISPRKRGEISTKPQKGTSLCKATSFEP